MTFHRSVCEHVALARSADAVTVAIPLALLASGFPSPIANPKPALSKAEKSWLQQQIDLLRRKARKRGFKVQKIRNGGFRVLHPDTAEILAGRDGDGIPIAEAWAYIATTRDPWDHDECEAPDYIPF